MAEETPPPDSSLEPQYTPKQLRAQQELRIVTAKNRALEISLEVIASDMERRLADGSLVKDMANMKVGSVLGHLTRISAAIKQAAVIVIPGGAPRRDATALQAQSAPQLSQHERMRRRQEAEAQDAEVVDE